MPRARWEWLAGLLLVIVGLAFVLAKLDLLGWIFVVIGVLTMGVGEANGAGMRDAILAKLRGG